MWTVWTGGKSRPHRDWFPECPARSQSLYRLSYPAHGVVSLCLIFPPLKHTERLVSRITHFNCTHFFLHVTLSILQHISQSNLENINFFPNLFYWFALSANNYEEVYSILLPALFDVNNKKFHTLTLKFQRSTFPSLSLSSTDLDLHLGNNPMPAWKLGLWPRLSSFTPDKCQNNTSMTLQTLPSRSFPNSPYTDQPIIDTSCLRFWRYWKINHKNSQILTVLENKPQKFSDSDGIGK